jgi:hypothetical protein
MIKALVSIDADLASSIALRYTCRLAGMAALDIQTIHIEDPEAIGPATGAGWARRTWEKEVVEEGRKEISQLLVAESGFCPVLKEPLVLSGDRDREILKQLAEGGYQLFVEGMPVQLSPKALVKKAESRFYQHAPCPVLLVQNLVPLEQALLIVQDDRECRCLCSVFSDIFGGARIEVDMLLANFQVENKTVMQETAARGIATEHGLTVHNSRAFVGNPELLSPETGTYGLVLIAMERPMRGRDPLVQLLGRLSSPILLCWK